MSTLVTRSNSTRLRFKQRMYEFTITHADLDAAATTQAIDLATSDGGFTYPVDAQIIGAWLVPDVAFSGGGVTALTCQVGDAGATSELIGATSLFTGVSLTKPLATNTALPRWEAAYVPQALFTATDANVAALTAGSVTICLLVEEVTRR